MQTSIINNQSLDTTASLYKEALESIWFLPTMSNDYLKIVLESFLGQFLPHQGLLLIDQTGKLIQSNIKARSLCRRLNSNSSKIPDQNFIEQELLVLPQQITILCKLLIDSRLEFPEQPLQLQEDIFQQDNLRVHLNGEWIALGDQSVSYILIRLEDVTETAGQRALCDACRYCFTQRETEVWALYLQGLSRQEISSQLFITMSTVHKHMKNIHSKRRETVIWC